MNATWNLNCCLVKLSAFFAWILASFFAWIKNPFLLGWNLNWNLILWIPIWNLNCCLIYYWPHCDEYLMCYYPLRPIAPRCKIKQAHWLVHQIKHPILNLKTLNLFHKICCLLWSVQKLQSIYVLDSCQHTCHHHVHWHLVCTKGWEVGSRYLNDSG
jgi:hypothetical protein